MVGRRLPFYSITPPPITPFLLPLLSRSVSVLSLRRLGACVSFLQSCALHRDLAKGRQTHAWVLLHGHHAYPHAVTSLINLYSKCGLPADAFAVFRAAEDASLFAWNAVVAGMATNGFPREALALYGEMRGTGIRPDVFTYPCVINACTDLMEAVEVRKIHGCLVMAGLELDVFVSSALVNSYLKMGFVEDAEKVFEGLPERDVVLWNSMVNGFSQTGKFEKALEFFQRMEKEGIFPSNYTVTGIISVFTAIGDFENGGGIHGLVKKCGHDSDTSIANSLIDMYGKAGEVKNAVEIFEAIHQRDIFSWNSMISVLQQAGDHVETLELFYKMRMAGVQPDAISISAVVPACAHMAALMQGREIHGHVIVSGIRRDTDAFMENAVMDMYAKCGDLYDAQLVFDRMRNRDIASWNILIQGYASHGHGFEVLGLFSRMCEAGMAPDVVTFVGVLSACGHTGLVERGREILESMEAEYKVIPTVEHYSCVVDMLGRAGRLAEAHDVLVSMPIKSNAVVWRAYMAACQVHGDMDRAVEAAKYLMEIDPEHSGSYVLLSNVLGSAGKYGEVLELRSSMRDRNVRKMPGCSWIEISSEVHAFITRDKSHQKSDEIYLMLHMLVAQLKESGYIPDIQRG